VSRTPILLAFFVLLLAADAEAQEADTVEYVVQAGDTCVGIARRVWHDRRRTDVLHQYNPQLGPPPHDLVPGTVLRLPRVARPGTGPDARVTQVQRRVEARPPQREDWGPAEAGLDLFRGWRVSTHERSSAELTFRDTSVVDVREDSLVVIFGNEAGPLRRGGSVAELDRGTLRSRLGELRSGNRLTVRAPGADAALAGGSAIVSVDQAGTSRVANHEGGAAVLTSRDVQGATVQVPAGMGSAVRRGERPTPPRPLPSAPTWTAGEPTRFLAVPGVGGTGRGSWQSSANASRYRVEISRNADGRDLVFATEVPASVTNVEARGLPAGTYFVRVATIDGELFEGRPGQPRTIEIVELAVEQPGGGTVAPRDVMLDDARPVELLPGTSFRFPTGVRCALGSDAPAETVTLTAGEERALACADRSGRVGAPAFTVTPVSVAATADADTRTLRRGEEGEVVFETSGPALPLELVPGPGLSVLDHTVEGSTHRTRLRVAADAPAQSSLGVVVAGSQVAVGSISVSTSDAPAVAVAPVETPAPAVLSPAPALPESAYRVPSPWLAGARDDRRRGLTAGVGAAVLVREDGEAQLRGAGHVGGAMLDDRLHLDVGVAFDVGGIDPLAVEGAGDVVASVMGVVHRDDVVTLSADLGAWLPTQPGPEGLGRVRLVPALQLGARPDSRIFVRVRSGATIDAVQGGDLLWQLAAALDLWLAEAFVLGFELDGAHGRVLGASFSPVTASMTAELVLGPVAVGVTARGGLTEDARQALGAFSALMHVRMNVIP